MPLYQYKPLDATSTEFRLVALHPRTKAITTDLRSDPLRCSIMTGDLGNPPPYHALSYCWGDPVFTNHITVQVENQQEYDIYITETLAIALDYIRKPVGDVILYIDQLCINQADVSEKNHQVRLMGSIYEKSSCVLAWLGNSTTSSDEFMDQINNSDVIGGLVTFPNQPAMMGKSDIQDIESFLENNTHIVDPSTPPEVILQHMLEYNTTISFPGFLETASRSWFRRVWIIQEAILGPELVFLCGSRRCCADCFGRAGTLIWLSSQLNQIQMEIDGKKPNRGTDELYKLSQCAVHAKQILGMRQAYKHKIGASATLFDLVKAINVSVLPISPNQVFKDIEAAVRFGATDPRDRIYAFIGLAKDDSETLRELEIDYKRPLMEVYRCFAAAVVVSTPELLVFSRNEPHSGLPSWAPDWASDTWSPKGYIGGSPAFKAGGAYER
ncbi:hypothetical protein NM208_g2087 [Fusarium decemcellulare]|uniref:Uncharacterized protein n=1 Tax=Fusarium decemcellulare TaxID=57161 RepID=A0ACC1STP8_9HYPO|nr:hypothetical protein NM208_g2087 [Fusarium decemcellulare]